MPGARNLLHGDANSSKRGEPENLDNYVYVGLLLFTITLLAYCALFC